MEKKSDTVTGDGFNKIDESAEVCWLSRYVYPVLNVVCFQDKRRHYYSI